ncbi:hypothetical protein BOTCAL_0408g00040 [Botryotinia calthae]|uniref:ABC transporter protein n=1 Tax=Botryotinia calthae TaxID=38488 RepID=A0A4Y8CPT8_9HELO|nr:hypothetical protein BOTCAL_0408g00040 [Botryotinia calthae]
MGKETPQPYKADAQRDTLEASNAASSSASFLNNVDQEYPEEDLPTYEETSSSAPLLSRTNGPSANNSQPTSGVGWYIPPPDLPFSSHDYSSADFWTRYPNYSTDPDALRQMILEQAQYAPTYHVELSGTHRETERRHKKDSTETITDFHIRLNLTHLLTTGIRAGGKFEILPDNQKGYRGGIIKSLEPSLSRYDIESGSTGDELQAWCEKFVSDPSSMKCFIFERKIINHDKSHLEYLLRRIVTSTNYRGQVHVNFPTSHKRVIVYSPHVVNEWRMTTWIRWFFYLTFLWVVSWPILFLVTRRYEVVKCVYQYADRPAGVGVSPRKPTVQSEDEFFNHWEAALRSAIMGRMIRPDSCLDEDYRVQILQTEVARGQAAARALNGTGNALADGAIGVITAATNLVGEYNEARGWGYDS